MGWGWRQTRGRLQGQPPPAAEWHNLTNHCGLSLCLVLCVSGKIAAFLVLKCLRLEGTHFSRRCTPFPRGRNHPLQHAGLPTRRLGFPIRGHDSSARGKQARPAGRRWCVSGLLLAQWPNQLQGRQAPLVPRNPNVHSNRTLSKTAGERVKRSCLVVISGPLPHPYN